MDRQVTGGGEGGWALYGEKHRDSSIACRDHVATPHHHPFWIEMDIWHRRVSMEGVKMRAHSATLNGGVGRYLGGEAETNDRTSQEKSKQEYVKYPQTI